MLLQKYQPGSLGEMIGNPDIFTEIRLWAQSWKQKTVQKPLLLSGPPGVGKTSVAYALAGEFGWSLVEFNASDVRDKETVEKTIAGAAVNASFDGNLRLVLIDEVDGIHGTKERGGLPAILSLLKNAQNPVILTANNIYGDRRLVNIRSFCRLLNFKKVPSSTLGKFLRETAEKEKIEYDAHSISALAKHSSGDVRGALLDLETFSSSNNTLTVSDVENAGYRENSQNIFTVMRSLFVSKSLQEIRKTRFSSEVDASLLKKWVEENIPRQFPMTPSISIAFDQLAKGDVFDGRIFRRQNYGFMRYSTDLVAGVGLQTPDRKHGFISYQFPAILKKLSSAKGTNKKAVIEKIQQKLRGSKSRIAQELFYWKIMLENEELAPKLVEFFEFDEGDLAFLFQTNQRSKKVQSLLRPKEGRTSANVKATGKKTEIKRVKKKVIEPKKEEAKPDLTPQQDQTSLSKFLS
jgi:replication factor C large subunit